MEHSHPLSERPYISLLPNESTVASLTTTPTCINPQSRRLQLRNVGFRGSTLPPRRVSPLLGTSQHASESFGRSANREHSPISPDKRMLYGEDLPPSPVNILQEIHNSKRRRRISPRTGFGQIFEDSTATGASGGIGSSWYNETSNNGSPTNPNMAPINIIKLREGSLNGKTPPPLSAPLVKQIKNRSENRPSPRSTSSEAAKYIEHLEAQLSAANAKLDSVTSPSTGKARSSKLRALTAESRSLRQEISDWERHFAERLKEEVKQRSEVETGLKTRLQILEDDIDVKDAKVRELECELEGIRDKVREAEKLEAVNVDLERRIDVLTNLIVRSPTKLDLYSATSSPSKADPHKRTPRPRSMLPRVPCSPGGVRLSLSTVSESTFWHSRSFGSASSISESPEGIDSAISEEDAIPPSPDRGSRQFSSIELGSGDSNFHRSARSPSSRPTSMQSSSSLGTTSWGLPLLPDIESQATSISRQRRMRRFPSGSVSLKPLILPTTTISPSIPASAPPCLTSPNPSRNVTDMSLDPTVAFLSSQELSSPAVTPAPQTRQDSTSWALEQTLISLEGRGRNPISADCAFSSPIDQRIASEESPLNKRKSRRSRPRSLEEELEQADLLPEKFYEDGLIPVDLAQSVEIDETSTSATNAESLQPCVSANDHQLRQRRTSLVSDTTPRPVPRPVPATYPSPNSLPSSSLTTRNTTDMFSRLTSLITRTKQDPVNLAQRLLHNAWTLGSARLGGLGWWLIGVLSRPYRRIHPRVADGAIVDGSSPNTFDWRPYSAAASRRRTAEHYLHDHGGEYELLPRETPPPGHISTPTIRPRMKEEPQIFPCDKCIEPSSHRTLRLWWQFSLAIVLAVGVAVKHGPGALLVDDCTSSSTCPVVPGASVDQQVGKRDALVSMVEGGSDTGEHRGDESCRGFAFAAPLGPADFEGA